MAEDLAVQRLIGLLRKILGWYAASRDLGFLTGSAEKRVSLEELQKNLGGIVSPGGSSWDDVFAEATASLAHIGLVPAAQRLKNLHAELSTLTDEIIGLNAVNSENLDVARYGQRLYPDATPGEMNEKLRLALIDLGIAARNCLDFLTDLIPTLFISLSKDHVADDFEAKQPTIVWSGPKPPTEWQRIFGLSWQTIKKRIDEGKIVGCKLSSKSWKIRAQDVPKN